jgi:hypothetical protein
MNSSQAQAAPKKKDIITIWMEITNGTPRAAKEAVWFDWNYL